ncbi:hypothetical protein Tsubulata_032834, partial [Turnera subulata]
MLMHNLRHGYSALGAYSRQKFDFRLALLNQTNYKNSLLKPTISKAESHAIAKQKHSVAESKRRRRINGQYEILRSTLPNLIKSSKASVLEETIRNLKELTKAVSELKASYGDGRRSLECAFPSGVDKLRLESCEGQGVGVVKVMFSCDDKRKLMSEVGSAVRSVKGKVERAEMVTMGGRTKCILWVQGINNKEEFDMLKKVIGSVTENPCISRTRPM